MKETNDNKTSNIELLTKFQHINFENKYGVSNEVNKKLYTICSKEPHTWTSAEANLVMLHSNNYTPNQYSSPAFNEGFVTIIPEKILIQNNVVNELVVKDIDTYWDAKKFNNPRIPRAIDQVNNKEEYDLPCMPRCIHLPLKLINSDVKLPNEYRQLVPALQKIINFEYTLNKNYTNYYAYLTIDQRFVPAEQTQRLPGAHVDGIPRNTKEPSNQKIDHCYLITNNLPTMFYNQSFPIDKYDPSIHNLFSVMRFFADDSKSILTKPYDINLMNAYSVHTSIDTQKPIFRTFLRLEFSVLQYDRIGNSINPYLDYSWQLRDCHIPSYLQVPQDLKDS